MITIKSAAIAGFLLLFISCSGEKKPALTASENQTLTTAVLVNGRSSQYILEIPADSSVQADKTFCPPDEPHEKPGTTRSHSWKFKTRGSGSDAIDPFREEKEAKRKAEAKAARLSHAKKNNSAGYR